MSNLEEKIFKIIWNEYCIRSLSIAIFVLFITIQHFQQWVIILTFQLQFECLNRTIFQHLLDFERFDNRPGVKKKENHATSTRYMNNSIQLYKWAQWEPTFISFHFNSFNVVTYIAYCSHIHMGVCRYLIIYENLSLKRPIQNESHSRWCWVT